MTGVMPRLAEAEAGVQGLVEAHMETLLGVRFRARYVTTLAFGIAVQAASGVARDELQEMADAALRNWPLT
ncbi:hypothetical protein ACFW95_34555 [Streptomyces sp. NPDC059474]|uniref:hypothetical protein n=1 Tax=Streptomyces sp. NPDC059474 TaxID=3346846 RepID=UPI0036901020